MSDPVRDASVSTSDEPVLRDGAGLNLYDIPVLLVVGDCRTHRRCTLLPVGVREMRREGNRSIKRWLGMTEGRQVSARRAAVSTLAVLAIIVTTGFLLSGCTRQAQSTARRPSHNPTAVSNVRTIVAAIEQDPCSTAQPGGIADCEGRYIAQVSQVADTALAAAADFPHPTRVRDAAQHLITTSTEFQKLSCVDRSDHRCTVALTAVDTMLRKLSAALNATSESAPAA